MIRFITAISGQKLASAGCPYRKLDPGKKGEVKHLRRARHSVCRSVIASRATKTATYHLLGVAEGAPGASLSSKLPTVVDVIKTRSPDRATGGLGRCTALPGQEIL
ncbi:MAG TPA: hypothetical protein VMA33_00215 [Candidatus Tectomicrobia bacterium]|nr:hypothetical protein [Candidatus Tectomicrobia bacterium]